LNWPATLFALVHLSLWDFTFHKFYDFIVRGPTVKYARLDQQIPRSLDHVEIANYAVTLPSYHPVLRTSNDALNDRACIRLHEELRARAFFGDFEPWSTSEHKCQPIHILAVRLKYMISETRLMILAAARTAGAVALNRTVRGVTIFDASL
ncbi:hypothetical protein FRC12_016905, partial [Ceratobasidium sp. 428]